MVRLLSFLLLVSCAAAMAGAQEGIPLSGRADMRWGLCPYSGFNPATHRYLLCHVNVAPTVCVETVELDIKTYPNLCTPIVARVYVCPVGTENPADCPSSEHSTKYWLTPDLNGDGGVGIRDYFKLLAGWITRPFGVADFTCLVGKWGQTMPPNPPLHEPECWGAP